jgi:hypothetical protein
MRCIILIGLLLVFKITTAQNVLDGFPVPQIIETPDSVANYQALVQSMKLPFLRYADTNFDGKAPVFWSKIDTIKVNMRKIRIIKTGGCKDSTGLPVKVENCTEHQYQTVNVFTNRVLRYTAQGINHSVLVEFVYNKKKLLVRYTENGTPSKLLYDASGKLLSVHCYEMVSGNPKLKTSYVFKSKKTVGEN